MFVYGFSHFRGFSRQQGVFPAHHALQFGKLSHHLGVEIGFGKVSGSIDGWFDRGVEVIGNICGQGSKSLHLLKGTTQFRMVDDLFQVFNPLIQFDFLIFLEKEIGVG